MRYIDIPNSHYAISETGKVLNKNTDKFMTPRKDNRHYKVTIWVNDYPVTFRIHYLVAMLFVENPQGFRHIRFKDDDTDNLNYRNLVWCEPFNGGKSFPEWQDVLDKIKASKKKESENVKPKELTELTAEASAMRNKDKEVPAGTIAEMKAELKRGSTLREVAFDYGLTVTIVKRLLA